MKFKQQALQLIQLDIHHQNFVVNPEGINFLKSLNKPISVISVAGLYRTGKSYLINQMLLCKNNAFKVGSTTEALTKGIWIWGTPILAKDPYTGQQFYHVIMDSQGIGSTQKDANYDCKILLLIFLLSSTVIYNTMGAIDQVTIQNLRVVIEMRKCMKISQNSSGGQFFPSLFWILRDFSLQLVDKKGKILTQNQYLQNSLQQKYQGIETVNSMKKNEIRKIIKTYFKQRQCFTLVRPILNEQKLQNLQFQDPKKLRPQFLSKLDLIRERIFTSSKSKKINNRDINGNIFAKLVIDYIDNLNQHKYPDVTCSWDMVTELANRQAFQQTSNKLDEKLKKIKLPQDPKTLKNGVKQIEIMILSQFKSKCYRNAMYGELAESLKDKIKKNYKNMKQKNQSYIYQRDLQQVQVFYNKNLKIPLQQLWDKNQGQFRELFNNFYSKVKDNAHTFKFYNEKLLQFIYIIIGRRRTQKQNLQNQINNFRQQIQFLKPFHNKYLNVQSKYENLQSKYQLKTNQQNQHHTQIALLKQKIQYLQEQVSRYRKNINQIQQNYRNTQQQSNRKSKLKQQQFNTIVKKLKQQNLKLQEEKQNLQSVVNVPMTSNNLTTQIDRDSILQNKLKDCFNRFQQQRLWWKQKQDTYKKQIRDLNDQKNQRQKKYKQQQQTNHQLKNILIQKQQFFQTQINQLKKTLKDTKLGYQKTNQTLIRNTQVFKNIQNLKTLELQRSNVKKSRIQNNTQVLQSQIRRLQSEMTQLKGQNKRLNTRCVLLEEKTKQQQSKKEKMKQQWLQLQNEKAKLLQLFRKRQQQLMSQNTRIRDQTNRKSQKLENTLVNMTRARQKQRHLYQESIKRLLINIQKKESMMNTSSVLNSNISNKQNHYQNYGGGRLSETGPNNYVRNKVGNNYGHKNDDMF